MEGVLVINFNRIQIVSKSICNFTWQCTFSSPNIYCIFFKYISSYFYFSRSLFLVLCLFLIFRVCPNLRQLFDFATHRSNLFI
jgi:hypothetical protein